MTTKEDYAKMMTAERDLIRWYRDNRPELMREVMCENCPEHIGELERKAYILNECERGHKA